MGPGRRFAKPNPFSSLWQIAAGGTSVAPPAITVASVAGLVVNLTNTGGEISSLSSTSGSQTGALQWTFTLGGVYVITATNAGGSSTATVAVGLSVAIESSSAYCGTGTGPFVPCGTGDGVRYLFNLATRSYVEQPTSGLRPIFRSTYMEGDGVGTGIPFTTAAAGVDVSDFLMGASFRLTGSPSYGMLFGNDSGRQSIRMGPGGLKPQTADGPALEGPADLSIGTDYRLIAAASGGTCTLYLNGSSIVSGAASSGLMSNTLFLMRRNDGYAMQGRLYRGAISAATTAWSVAAFDAWLAAGIP